MAYAKLADCELYYQSEGEGTPVVYVHGGFAGLDTVLRENEWDWEKYFAAHCQFVTYDRRGCARSSSPDSGYDLVTQAQDLAGLLDELGLKSAHVIGSSAGGPIAYYFAALYPERVRSLILVGTAIDLFPLGEPGSDLVRNHLVILEREGAVKAFEQRPEGVEVSFNELWDKAEAIARGKVEEYRARVAKQRELAEQLPMEKRAHYYMTELLSMEAYMTTTIHAHAEAVSVPTLILQGSNDQLVPLRDAGFLAQVIRDATLEVFEGGPHSLMARREDARERVLAWLGQVEGTT